jgi:AefR-like transcriptional repressor, C-terminal domain
VAATFYEVAIQPTAQTMTDWLCRQAEHGKIELEDTQTAVKMLRGMMVMDTQRAVMLGQRAVPDQDAPEIVFISSRTGR